MPSIIIGCSKEEFSEPVKVELTRGEANAVEAVNDFAFDLLRATENRFGKEKPNYIMSPQSAAWCVAMVANGASYGSETLAEMIEVLHLGDDASLQDMNDYSSKLIDAIDRKTENASFSVANAVYYKSGIGIRREYVNTLKTFYGSDELADKSNSWMDSWISKRTGELIRDFASKSKLDKNDFGVINTTYLAAKWLSEFNHDRSRKFEFRNADGSISMVPMLFSKSSSQYVSHDKVCHLLKLWFYGPFCMYFVIPNDGHDIHDVLMHLNGETWKSLLANKSNETVSTKFPILDISTDFDFKDVIQDMGVRKAFSADSELTEIAANPIRMTSFDQSNVLKLDEKGVEASSSSHFSGGETAYYPGEISFFIMDEPFYYFITEQSTGAIIYAGKISQL